MDTDEINKILENSDAVLQYKVQKVELIDGKRLIQILYLKIQFFYFWVNSQNSVLNSFLNS